MAARLGDLRRYGPLLAWLLAGVPVLALPLAWRWWSHEQAQLSSLRGELRREADLLPLSRQVVERVAAWRLLSARPIAAQDGDAPDAWARRTLTVDNQKMSRAEADQYLRALHSSGTTLFAPSVVTVRAPAGESIYAALQGQDRADALAVTLHAELYARSAP